jgi:hypothetical protein
MSFRIEMRQRVRRKLSSLNLPDAILVEVHLQISGRLSNDPAASLVRMLDLFDGLVFPFEMIDPDNRLSVHRIFFHVCYSMDEGTIILLDCAYQHTIGL